MNVVGYTPDTVCLAFAIAAHGSKIGMHSRPDGHIEPRIAIFRAEDNVKDCLAEGLRHWLLRYDAGFQPANVNCRDEPRAGALGWYETGRWPGFSAAAAHWLPAVRAGDG